MARLYWKMDKQYRDFILHVFYVTTQLEGWDFH